MAEPFAFWIFLVILVGAAAIIWAVTGQVARRDDDLEEDERAMESAWISETIEHWGGDVPVPVVDQVLELHRRYLGGPGFEIEAEPVTQAETEAERAVAPDAGADAEPAAR